MKTIPLGASGLSVPAIAVGCMRITGLSEQELDRHLLNCMAEGLNFFDHADIYGAGRCEEVFAASVKRTGLRREDMFLQSKCGICDGDFLDEAGVQALANLPSKEVLIAKIMGSLNAPVTNFVYAVEAVRKKLAGEE